MSTAADLDALIEELTVDAYDDEEQLSGLLIGAEEASARGEQAVIAGVTVEVLRIDCGPDARTGLTAWVLSDGARHEVALADLTFPAGSELGVVAYRRWQGR